LMLSGFGCHCFPNVHPLGVPLATLSWPCPWRPCSLQRATLAQRVIPLQAVANFYRDPQFPWVRTFGFWRHSVARFRPLCCFLSPPTSFTAACSLGTSRCSTLDSMSSEVGSLHSRCASVIS
jgi:hypothetical protein